jgi:hypothetical protein
MRGSLAAPRESRTLPSLHADYECVRVGGDARPYSYAGPTIAAI